MNIDINTNIKAMAEHGAKIDVPRICESLNKILKESGYVVEPSFTDGIQIRETDIHLYFIIDYYMGAFQARPDFEYIRSDQAEEAARVMQDVNELVIMLNAELAAILLDGLQQAACNI